MDSITQAALGACIAQAGFEHKLGKRAVYVGAMCGILPDLDFLLSIGQGEFATLVVHRGPSHSLLVLPWVALVVAFAARWWGQRQKSPPEATPPSHVDHYWTWVHLCFWALITHPMLDVFTTYGTQLLAPFSNQRFALDGVSIIDPMYTVPLAFVVIVGLRASWRPTHHRLWASVALVLTTGYLFLGLANSNDAERVAVEQLEASGFDPVEVRAHPTFLQNVLWRVVARDPDGNYAVGVFSTLARDDIEFEIVDSETGPLVQKALDSEEGQIFHWFSTDFLRATAEVHEDGTTITLWDMRYGLVSDPLYSPFAAVFEFDRDDVLVSASRRKRDTGKMDVGNELGTMWGLIKGR